jgi:hypothetical protein
VKTRPAGLVAYNASSFAISSRFDSGIRAPPKAFAGGISGKSHE